MQNGSEEPYATAAPPSSGAMAGPSSPQPTATTKRASSSASRQPSDDKAGASPDEAIADKAETA
jgi:hypothetical protein